MGNLIAKVMSREPMLDSDPRKSFKLIPVPEDHEVEFQRTEIANVVNMLFTALYGDARGTLIPLADCGKVYILQDGKTVSTFDPEPKPETQLNVQGELCVKVGGDTLTMNADTITLQSPGLKLAKPISQTINIKDVEGYKQLKADLDLLAPANVYPWAGRWNEVIATIVGATGGGRISLSLTTEEMLARDEQAINRYFGRVNDAVLNAKEPIMFTVISPDAAGCTYQLTFGGKPRQLQEQLVMIQTHKQNFINYDVNGMVINNVQRAIKLLNYGASTVIVSPKLKITEEEITLIKRYFREVFGYSVKFHFEGDLLISMSFDKISPAVTAS